MDKDTAKFCKELWSLCLSAQENPQGVPKELLEAKKLELIQEKASYSIPSCASHLLTILQIEAEKAAEEARRQKEQERVRERELEELRRRERSERGRGGRRGGRGGRDFDRRRSRDRFQDRPSRREFDSYVPSGSRRNRRPSRSPSRSRSPSASRSPPPRRERQPSRDRNRRRRSPSNSVSPDRDRRPRRRSPDYEETDGDGDPFLPTVHPVHLLPGTGAEKTLIPDLVLGRVSRMIEAPDGEDLRLILQELIRKNPPLILQRPARTVTIAA